MASSFRTLDRSLSARTGAEDRGHGRPRRVLVVASARPRRCPPTLRAAGPLRVPTTRAARPHRPRRPHRHEVRLRSRGPDTDRSHRTRATPPPDRPPRTLPQPHHDPPTGPTNQPPHRPGDRHPALAAIGSGRRQRRRPGRLKQIDANEANQTKTCQKGDAAADHNRSRSYPIRSYRSDVVQRSDHLPMRPSQRLPTRAWRPPPHRRGSERRCALVSTQRHPPGD